MIGMPRVAPVLRMRGRKAGPATGRADGKRRRERDARAAGALRAS